MELINLTRYPVTFRGLTIQPALCPPVHPLPLNIVANKFATLNVDDFGDIPLEKVIHGPLDLPPRESGTMYIVTMSIAQLVRRDDFVTPDFITSDTEDGSFRGFIQILNKKD